MQYRQKCLCPVISSVAIGLKTISYLICLQGQMHCILFDIWHKKPTNIYGFYLEMNEKRFVSMNEYYGLINKFRETWKMFDQHKRSVFFNNRRFNELTIFLEKCDHLFENHTRKCFRQQQIQFLYNQTILIHETERTLFGVMHIISLLAKKRTAGDLLLLRKGRQIRCHFAWDRRLQSKIFQIAVKTPK